MKMHTLLNLRGAIPAFVWMTEGKVNDMNGLDVLPVEANAYYLMDKDGCSKFLWTLVV